MRALNRVAGLSAFVVASTTAFATINPPLAHPLLFVTQVPTSYDNVNMTISAPFANHLPTTLAAPRGGDLVLLSTTGTLRYLTQEAGYGSSGGGALLTGNQAIAVRDPAVNWDATRAIFSMVVGAPATPGGAEGYTWQLYEVTNLDQVVLGADPALQIVANQPSGFNNIAPAYLSDDNIVFVSDRPRNGSLSLYPILDEYRTQPANSGLWRLDPVSGAVTLLENTPSGSFAPFVDSFGRLVFTRWDHLNQDLNNDPATSPPTGRTPFDYVSETATATTGLAALDRYPEPIHALAGSNLNGFEINQLFPWVINQDGTNEEILNHLGRHELLPAGFKKTYTNDANLIDFDPTRIDSTADPSMLRKNQNPVLNLFQIREDPMTPGRYVGVDGMEFFEHHAGQIVAVNAPASANADDITVAYLTDRQTQTPFFAGASYPYNIGHFRDPLPMTDGTLIASFANTPGSDNNNNGPATLPLPQNPSFYNFQIYRLTQAGAGNPKAQPGEYLPDDPAYGGSGGPLTGGGITKTLTYYYSSNLAGSADGQLTAQSYHLWELQPVEVVGRTKPAPTAAAPLAASEQNVFNAYNAAHAGSGITVPQMQRFLKSRDLALVVIRNATSRDDADMQQPYNLEVAGVGGTRTTSGLGLYSGPPLYCIDRMQFFEADQVRGLYATGGGSVANPLPGRRPLPLPLNDPDAVINNMPGDVNIPGSQFIAPDGSVALFVPARRPMVWQSLQPAVGAPACGSSPNPASSAVVRERYWIQFQPGEIRACNSCHGVNKINQHGDGAPANDPQALTNLLTWWKANGDYLFADGFGD